jgi:hypothetical protein
MKQVVVVGLAMHAVKVVALADASSRVQEPGIGVVGIHQGRCSASGSEEGERHTNRFRIQTITFSFDLIHLRKE